MLIGSDASIVLNPVRASFFENSFDFCKPMPCRNYRFYIIFKIESEYPVVNG